MCPSLVYTTSVFSDNTKVFSLFVPNLGAIFALQNHIFFYEKLFLALGIMSYLMAGNYQSATNLANCKEGSLSDIWQSPPEMVVY